MKRFQGIQCAVGVFGEKEISDQCFCINIRFGGEENTPLIQAGEPVDFFPQIPLEEH